MSRKKGAAQAAKKTKARRLEVKSDPVSPRDFNQLNIIFACEQCSHFDGENISCTIGYNAKNHLKETNLKSFHQTGRMAFCRYQEID